MSATSSEKSFCILDTDTEEKHSDTQINEKEDMQKDDKRNLQCSLVKKIYPVELRSWPIFSLLKPDFILQIHMVMVYCSGNRAIIVAKDKNVYSLSYNQDDDSKTDKMFQPYLKKIKELCGKNIKTFAHGYCHALALTEEGKVYYWEFKKRNFSVGSFIPFIPKPPTRVAGLSEICIVDIACREDHSLALTNDGKVYAWRENEHGLVGNESTAAYDGSLPRQVKHVLENENVVHIACGSKFNIVLTDEGKLYGWGSNEYSQISNDNTTLFGITPNSVFDAEQNSTKSSFVFNSVDVNASNMSDGSINPTGKFSFGVFPPNLSNTVDPSNPYVFGVLPQYTKHSPNIFRSKDSSPFGIDQQNSKNSSPLFASKDANSQTTSSKVLWQQYYVYPREIITIANKIVKVACGNYHTLALTDEGKVYCWGRNQCGQIGINNELKISGPIMVNMPMVKDIAACGNTSVAVDNNGTIYVWGRCFGQNNTAPLATTFSQIYEAFAYDGSGVMHEPLIVSTDGYNIKGVFNILGSLEAAFDDPATSDTILQVEGQPIHVHKAILKIRSQYFKDKFQRDWTENNQSTPDPSTVYTVSDQNSYIVYKAFLKYLYTGTVDISSENALELMKLADKYCEANLKEGCIQKIKQAVTVPNVAFFYNQAIECSAQELEEFCFQFILDNMKGVILSEEFKELDLTRLHNFLRSAAEKDAFKS